MHLTLYTDYTLRVMMYLAVKHTQGGTATIDEMARAYSISRSHLTKIVNELAQNGFIETTRGRSGGARLARQPSEISVGSLVRMAEKDFAIVQCHAAPVEVNCAILPACNLRYGLRRAADAFLYELDKMTLEQAIITPSVAASLLHLNAQGTKEITVPARSLAVRNRQPAVKATSTRASGVRTAARPRTAARGRRRSGDQDRDD